MSEDWIAALLEDFSREVAERVRRETLDAAAVREQRLRAALEQIATIPRVFAGVSGYTQLGNELNASVEQARQMAQLALAATPAE